MPPSVHWSLVILLCRQPKCSLFAQLITFSVVVLLGPKCVRVESRRGKVCVLEGGVCYSSSPIKSVVRGDTYSWRLFDVKRYFSSTWTVLRSLPPLRVHISHYITYLFIFYSSGKIFCPFFFVKSSVHHFVGSLEL